MRRSCIAILCGVCLIACRSAPLPADELDDLLAGKPAPVDSVAAPLPADSQASYDLDVLDRESTSYVLENRWHPVITPSVVRSAAESSISSDAPPKQAAPQSASPVPEPSAVLLGGLALLYFLLFGRRRRIA